MYVHLIRMIRMSSIPKEQYTGTCDAVQDDYSISGSEGAWHESYV